MHCKNTFNSSRRRWLANSSKLGLASGLGIISPSNAQAVIENELNKNSTTGTQSAATVGGAELKPTSWQFDQLYDSPEQLDWQILDAHDTGHITPEWEDPRHSLYHRIKLESAPDGRPSYCHRVRKREIVHPVGSDSRAISVDFSNFSKVLMRYHHWIETPSYLPGKWIGLQLGRGWVAKGYVQRDTSLYGTDGCSSTTMHPGRDDGNGIRLLSTHLSQRDQYGDRIGRGLDILPTGRWLTVDVIVDRYQGHRLYVDGQIRAIKSGVVPVKNWNACRAIWYRNRLMHGGTPKRLPAVKDYREWFGGFFIGVA